MSPEPTEMFALDYLIEICDEGKFPDQPASEVIVIPPPATKHEPPRKPDAGDMLPQ